ncbi:MAG: FAD-binding oxidoreductase, partial [Candidatus Korarchaeota archaeon]|nr:FAD-binding oxidoreductase [Candidatus Korarchaeota archaeon]
MVEYDAVIVGAGILGLSTAYHIKKKNPRANVLVVDRLNAAGQANTSKSGSAFRCLFSSLTNYLLADSSVEFYNHLQKDLDVDLKLKWIGYLWLLTEMNFRKIVPVLKDLKGRGLEYEEYDGDRLASMLCMKTELSTDEEAQLMQLEDVHKGVYIPKAGVIDADYLVRYYEEEFQRLDGKIEYCVDVENL